MSEDEKIYQLESDKIFESKKMILRPFKSKINPVFSLNEIFTCYNRIKIKKLVVETEGYGIKFTKANCYIATRENFFCVQNIFEKNFVRYLACEKLKVTRVSLNCWKIISIDGFSIIEETEFLDKCILVKINTARYIILRPNLKFNE